MLPSLHEPHQELAPAGSLAKDLCQHDSALHNGVQADLVKKFQRPQRHAKPDQAGVDLLNRYTCNDQCQGLVEVGQQQTIHDKTWAIGNH